MLVTFPDSFPIPSGRGSAIPMPRGFGPTVF